MAREISIVDRIITYINNMPHGVAEKVQGTSQLRQIRYQRMYKRSLCPVGSEDC